MSVPPTHAPPTHVVSPTVHLICPVHNGARFLGEFLRSLTAQTHTDWRLWVLDDASRDDSAALVRACAAADPRVVLLAPTAAPQAGVPTPRGAAAAFAWLWDALPPDADYVMFADQDDVWLPGKIAQALAAMRAAESERAGPVLVHTDAVVVDATLRQIAPSFWRYAQLTPEPATVQRFVVLNVVTGNTVLLNRALRDRVGRIPAAAAMHDWWVACVAAAFGRVVAVPTPSVWYRQHGANTIGARDAAWPTTPWSRLRMAARAIARTATVRTDIATAARQAEALLAHYGNVLPLRDQRFLRAYGLLPSRGLLQRKWLLLRWHLRPERGLLRNLGLLLRA
jgi:glycosyltransferase involved in cell wall biosynthesis